MDDVRKALEKAREDLGQFNEKYFQNVTAERRAAIDVIEAAEIFLDDFLSKKTCAPGALQRALAAWAKAVK